MEIGGGIRVERESKMMKKMMMVMMIALTGCVSIGSSRSVSDGVKESIKSNWKNLVRESEKVTGLHDGMKSLPDSSILPWVTDKGDQQAKIRRELGKVRELLLSTNAQKLMKEVDAIDRALAKNAAATREATEARALDLERTAEYDAKLAKLAEQRTGLEAERKVRAKAVVAELRELGITVSGEAAEQCLFPVNFDDLVDGAVVARNIGAVVENLRTLMKDGSVDASRRYFGMYLTMVEVQVATYEDYLEKSRHGSWRTGIEKIRGDATNARETALSSAKSADFTEEQRRIFAHNADVNGATVRAAEAYLKVLDAHEKVIAGKLETAEKVRKVVANSYETVTLAGDFLAIAKSNEEAFDSLLQLDLPPIEMFNDAAVQEEFLAITRKLKE